METWRAAAVGACEDVVADYTHHALNSTLLAGLAADLSALHAAFMNATDLLSLHTVAERVA